MAVVTVYRGARNPVPVGSRDLSWPDFVRHIQEASTTITATDKRNLAAFGPHALRIPYRLAENVDHVSMLVVDVDNDDRPTNPITPDAIVARLAGEGIESLVYESPRSTPELPKFRVVATITEPIPPDACRECRTRFTEMLGLGPKCGVHQAIEAAKLFFVGRLEGLPPRRVWVVPGIPTDPRSLPPNSAEWASHFREAPEASPHLADLPPADQGLVAALGPWQQHAGRKWSVCGALGGLMRGEGYNAVECESVIREWLDGAPPDVDVDAGVQWALGAWAKDVGEVSGEDELARHVGTDHARVIASAVERGSWVERTVATRPKVRSLVTSPALAAGSDVFGRRASFLEEDAPIPYLCPGLCIAPAQGKISLVGGLPGAGKGPWVSYLAVCFAFGLPVLGRWPVTRCPVLYLDFEGERLTKRRMFRIARGLGRDPRELHEAIELIDMTGRSGLDERLFDRCKHHDAPLIFVDSYTTAMMPSGLDANKPEFARLALMLGALDKCVISVAHARKPPIGERGERPMLADIMGSGALGAMAATALSVWKPDEANDYLVRIGCARAPETSFATFEVEFRGAPSEPLVLECRDVPKAEHAAKLEAAVGLEAATNALLRFMRGNPYPWGRKELSLSVLVGLERVPEGQVGSALTVLTNAGLVTRHAGIGGKGPTFEITSVQTCPDAVRVRMDGTVEPVVGEFRRPT